MAQVSNLLQIHAARKSFGARNLFEDVHFSINENEHVGVIGPNGAGKTTLFKILIGEESLDEGQLIRSRELRLGYLSQHDSWEPGETANTFLERVSRLPLWQIKSKGRELQLGDEIFDVPIKSLSGGYRMRIKLLALIGQDPNLMLLDEPTNYLDLETTLILENFLQSYEGAFLLISHDREFLRRTTDHILEIEQGDVVKYNGNIDDYFEQKELLRSQLEARSRNLAEKRKAILEFVNRFGAKATKARQAQSRLKSLKRMETIELKPLAVGASIRIPPPPHVGKVVLQLSEVALGYPEKKVLEKVNVEIKRGDHVAVVGLNGAGKSTLLKGLAGTLAPSKGERVLGYQVHLAIFNQHVVEVLDPSQTVFESLEEAAGPDLERQQVLDMAGSLLFSGDAIRKKIKVLSGGEKSRVALGRILLQKAPLLLLDEPTNHLDFQTVEALTQALEKYPGTLVVVSHDRGFIRRIGTKILEVSSGQVLVYPGSYDEYVWSVQMNLGDSSKAYAEVDQHDETPKEKIQKQDGFSKKDRDRKIKELQKSLAKVESKIEKLEQENKTLNEQIVAGSSDLSACASQMANNSLMIQELETEWAKLGDEIESLSS